MPREVNYFCDVDNCPGRTFLPPNACDVCSAGIHMECFLGTVRKLKEYPDGCHDEVFCSDVCCIWHGNPRINVEEVRKEREELLKLLKKQLIELARAAKVRVTQRVDKKYLQLSKSSMVRRLVAAKFNAALGNPSETSSTIRAEKTVHVRFRLINCIFSDDLSSAARDADNVDRSALDSGAVGDNSPFWKLCEERFNNGFPVNSIHGPTFADKLHFNHVTIDNYHEGVNPCQH
jgi:hypothetical protein